MGRKIWDVEYLYYKLPFHITSMIESCMKVVEKYDNNIDNNKKIIILYDTIFSDRQTAAYALVLPGHIPSLNCSKFIFYDSKTD